MRHDDRDDDGDAARTDVEAGAPLLLSAKADDLRRLPSERKSNPSLPHLLSSADGLWRSSSAPTGYQTNAFFEFVDPSIQNAFIDFKAAQFGARFFTVPVSTFIIILFVLYWIFALRRHANSLGLVTFAFTCSATLPLLVLLTCVTQARLRCSSRTRRWLETAFLLAMSLSVGLTAIFRSTNGQCEDVGYYEIWTCAPMAHLHNLTPDLPMILAFVPLVCSFTLPAISAYAFVASYAWAAFVHIFLDVVLRSQFAPPWQIVLFAFLLLLHAINAWTQVQLFLFCVRIDGLQRQQDEDAERQTYEKRKLIGKLAHDIRTPLVAFSYGLDVLKSSLVTPQGSLGVSARSPLLTALSARAPCVGRARTAQPQSHFQAESRSNSQSRASTPGTLSQDGREDHGTDPGGADPSAAAAAAASRSLSARKRQTPMFADAVEGLEQSHQQLMMMINRFVDYNKLSLGLPLVPTYSPVSVTAMVDTALDHARRTLNGWDVRVEWAETVDFLVTDPCWLHDNLLCMISNAIRFSSPRQPVIVRVLRSSRQEACQSQLVGGSMLKFEVEDFGVGVVPAMRDSLFAAPDGAAERSMGGAGLGLYCLAERVKALQGEVGVRYKGGDCVEGSAPPLPMPGAPDGGCAFWFSLPLPPGNALDEDLFVLRCRDSLRSLGSQRSSLSSSHLLVTDLDVALDAALASRGTDGDEGSLLSLSLSVSLGPHTAPAPTGGVSSAGSHQSSSSAGGPARAQLSLPPLPSPEQLTPSVEERLVSRDPEHPSLAEQVQHLRVLVVDDSPLILKMLKMIFQSKGHDVVATPSALEGLALLRESFYEYLTCVQQERGRDAWRHFDAVLIDIQMPIMDGLEMMRQYDVMREELRRLTDHGLPWPVIVAMSANTDHEIMQNAYAAGAHHFLRKPFDLDTFYAVFVKQRERPA